jgi:hypothetical protein
MVIGKSGVGIIRFINAIRGMGNNHENYLNINEITHGKMQS